MVFGNKHHCMEYFVTGATGFMGTKLVEQLVDDGHNVVALTRSRLSRSTPTNDRFTINQKP